MADIESTATGDLQGSRPPSYPPRDIRILGAGRFGYMAAERLGRRHPQSSFLVVDQNGEKLERIRRDIGLPVLQGDAVAWLEEDGGPGDETWIIPAVPIHVAVQWLVGALNGRKGTGRHAYPIMVPEEADIQVPNPYRVPSGTLYASFATFLCPDICNEPDEICTHTGQPRPGNLFERLAAMRVAGFDTIVVRSWQLAPGVGGYPMASLRAVLGEIERKPGTYLIATCCRCHGVIDGLRWEARTGPVFP